MTWCVPVNTFVLAPLYRSEPIGCLFIFPAAALPFNCAVKELAALVLLPVSATRLVFGEPTGPEGAGVDPPQAQSITRRHEDKAQGRQRERRLRGTKRLLILWVI